LSTLGPVLVTAEPARTAKLAAVPRPTGGCAASARAEKHVPSATAQSSDTTTPIAGLGLEIALDIDMRLPSLLLDGRRTRSVRRH